MAQSLADEWRDTYRYLGRAESSGRTLHIEMYGSSKNILARSFRDTRTHLEEMRCAAIRRAPGSLAVMAATLSGVETAMRLFRDSTHLNYFSWFHENLLVCIERYKPPPVGAEQSPNSTPNEKSTTN
jgi:hypothetical protein